MRILFDELPSAVRERFVRITHDDMDRRAFFRHHYPALDWVGWMFAVIGLVVAVGTAYWLVNEEWGHKDPYFDREVYALLFGAIFVFAVAAVGRVYRAIFGASPYRRGIYVFASALVEAQRGWLHIVPIDRIGRPTIVNRYRNGVYQGSWLQLHDVNEPKRLFTIQFSSQQQAQEAVGQLDQARATYARIASQRDFQQLTSVDPFYECTTSGQWTNPENARVPGPTSKPVPVAAHVARWVGALVIAGVATAALFMTIQSECEANPRTPGAPYYQGCMRHDEPYVPSYSSPYGSGYTGYGRR